MESFRRRRRRLALETGRLNAYGYMKRFGRVSGPITASSTSSIHGKKATEDGTSSNSNYLLSKTNKKPRPIRPVQFRIKHAEGSSQLRLSSPCGNVMAASV